MLLLVIVVMVALSTIHLATLWKRRGWGEPAVAAFFWIVATVYASLLVAGVRIINPARAVIDLLDLVYQRF